MYMKMVDEAAAHRANTQHGAFTIRQVGASRSARDRRVANGRWVRSVEASVYTLPHYPPSWRQRLIVAILGSPAGALASHRSGAVLHGVREGAPIEVTVPRSSHSRPSSGLVHQSDVPMAQRSTIDGIPVTRIERTLVDLASVVGDDEVEQAVEAALRRGLTTADRLVPQLASARPGAARLRRVLDRRARGRPAGSELEVLVIQLLRAAGLADPVRQHEVRIGGERYFLDLAYPERRVCIEVDGREAHEGEAFQRDRTRQNALILAGWTVLRFTWADATKRAGYVTALVTQALVAA